MTTKRPKSKPPAPYSKEQRVATDDELNRAKRNLASISQGLYGEGKLTKGERDNIFTASIKNFLAK